MNVFNKKFFRHTKYKNTPIQRKIFIFLLLLIVLCILWLYHLEKSTHVPSHSADALPSGFVPIPSLSETPGFMKDEGLSPLSTQETLLLEQLKTETEVYTEQFTNGEIEFSVTLYRIRQPKQSNFFAALWKSAHNLLNSPNEVKKEKPLTYDTIGEWDITYRFDRETEFFDVKAHKKREMDRSKIISWTQDGQLRQDIWQKTHHQFLRHRKETLYIRKGAKWKPYDKERKSLSVRKQAPHFDQRYSPYWWHYGHDADFNTFIHRYKATDIKTFDIDGSSQVYLQVYYTEQKKKTHRARTLELWMDPKREVHPTRILISTRTAGMYPEYDEGWMFSTPEPIPGTYTYSESINFKGITSELAQYEPGIWFPETVTEEYFTGTSLSKLFPDLTRSQYPVIMNEAHLPEWFREKYQNAPIWKRVMKVQSASFNLPTLKMPDFSP